jgi:hypothetical protein
MEGRDMKWTATAFGLTLAVLANAASAATTKDFIYRCSTDEVGCAAKIKDVRRVIENPPPGQRAPARICFPPGLSDEGLANEVAMWIDEQVPAWDNRNEFDSIADALVALYSCDGVKGLEGINQ